MLFNSLEFLFLFLPTLLLAFFWLGRYSHRLALRVAGMAIGDHTARHPKLAKLDSTQMLPRFTPWQPGGGRFLRSLLRNLAIQGK